MKIKRLQGDFTVCKVADFSEVDLQAEYCFIGKTEEENSLVCRTELEFIIKLKQKLKDRKEEKKVRKNCRHEE